MTIMRLHTGEEAMAGKLFLLFSRVLEEPSEPLSVAYTQRLLSEPRFWALTLTEDDELHGGITAWTLSLTRRKSSELFVYDVAVHPDYQGNGYGRAQVEELRRMAAGEDTRVLFVPADNDDQHALDFYRAIGGDPAPVTIFTFGE